jgi:GDP-L-fucose synthase
MNIFVAGHQGMVGSALCRRLNQSDDVTLITANRSQLDLINQSQVIEFFKKNRIDQVYLAAAKVGGIHANNTYPGQFIYENLMIQNNIVDAALRCGVEKLLFLGSSCIYPKLAVQPISENQLLSGELEPTNEPYAIAKIAGIKLCESYNRQYGVDYRSLMPTNLYGPGDNYHPLNSHVIPGLLRKFHEAKASREKIVSVWGTGNALREFLHVDDLASASVFLMNLEASRFRNANSPFVNVGSGEEISIYELVNLVKGIVGFNGEVSWDNTKPDGTPRKLLDCSLLSSFNWAPKIKLSSGLVHVYKEYASSAISSVRSS